MILKNNVTKGSQVRIVNISIPFNNSDPPHNSDPLTYLIPICIRSIFTDNDSVHQYIYIYIYIYMYVYFV